MYLHGYLRPGRWNEMQPCHLGGPDLSDTEEANVERLERVQPHAFETITTSCNPRYQGRAGDALDQPRTMSVLEHGAPRNSATTRSYSAAPRPEAQHWQQRRSRRLGAKRRIYRPTSGAQPGSLGQVANILSHIWILAPAHSIHVNKVRVVAHTQRSPF